VARCIRLPLEEELKGSWRLHRVNLYTGEVVAYDVRLYLNHFGAAGESADPVWEREAGQRESLKTLPNAASLIFGVASDKPREKKVVVSHRSPATQGTGEIT
jgi:hypothetical protein